MKDKDYIDSFRDFINEENTVDTIKLDVPLFIRLLEYAREEAETDMDLHDLVEGAIKLSLQGKTLTMQDYITLVKKEIHDFIKEEIQNVLSEEKLDEGFEWYHPLIALGGAIGLVSTAVIAAAGPANIIMGRGIAGGMSWGDVLRHYKKKFNDKRAAKNLKKEDVQELINLIQLNLDAGDLPSGVKRYMKSLLNRLEKEMSKDVKELDKNKLLVLLRDVENYAKRNQIKF